MLEFLWSSPCKIRIYRNSGFIREIAIEDAIGYIRFLAFRSKPDKNDLTLMEKTRRENLVDCISSGHLI